MMSPEEIAHAALGMEYMSVGNGNGQQQRSEQDWRSEYMADASLDDTHGRQQRGGSQPAQAGMPQQQKQQQQQMYGPMGGVPVGGPYTGLPMGNSMGGNGLGNPQGGQNGLSLPSSSPQQQGHGMQAPFGGGSGMGLMGSSSQNSSRQQQNSQRGMQGGNMLGGSGRGLMGGSMGGVGGGMGNKPMMLNGGGPMGFASSAGGSRMAPAAAMGGYGPATAGLGPPMGSMPMQMGGYAPMGEYGGGMGQDFGLNDFGGMGGTEAGMGMGGSRYVEGRMMGGGMGNDGGGGQGSRAIFVNQLPPGTTYEELCDSVGPFGSLESIKILDEKRQGFVNFVSPHDAFQLMVTTGQQIILHGKTLSVHWGKTRPVPRDLLTAIRNGATRNLYVSNVPESLTEAALTTMFSPFGELESIRLVPKKRAGFVNFTSILCAIRAKEAIHAKPSVLPRDSAAGEVPPKPLLINFTSAQQNCMRARGGGRADWGGGMGGMGRSGGYDRGEFGSGRGRDRFNDHRGGGRYGGRRAGGGYSGGQSGGGNFGYQNSALPSSSRALYFGSLPDNAGLHELAGLVESVGLVESMRLVRPKSCAFVNFQDETVAKALLARFTSSEDAAPEVCGKRLTVNFAKARPCSEDQLKRIADGVRRKLRARGPATEEQVRERLGHKAELLVHLVVEESKAAESGLTNGATEGKADAETKPKAEGEADGAGEGQGVADATFRLEFLSLAAAIASKQALESADAEPSFSVEYIVEPIASAEELQAMLPAEASGDAAEEAAQGEPAEANEHKEGEAASQPEAGQQPEAAQPAEQSANAQPADA